MGWAKYYEDNISICTDRMAMKDTISIYHAKPKKPYQKKAVVVRENRDLFSSSVVRPKTQNGRRGLELVFYHELEKSMSRKLQMNGWWWSKTNTSWCNADTASNRRFAESMVPIGAKVYVVH